MGLVFNCKVTFIIITFGVYFWAESGIIELIDLFIANFDTTYNQMITNLIKPIAKHSLKPLINY